MNTKNLIIAVAILLFAYSPIESQVLRDTMLLANEITIHFATNDSEITDFEKTYLNKFISNCKDEKDYRIFIDAHTDDVGTTEFNVKLSKERSQSIRDYLIQNGIAIDKIHSKYFGESMPLVARKDEQGRQINRRGTLHLYKKIKLKLLRGTVTDEANNKISNAAIEVISKNFTTVVKSDTEGKFEVFVPVDAAVTISAVAKNYFYKSSKIEKADMSKTQEVKFEMPKLEKDKKFIIDNLLFYRKRSNILISSWGELRQLERMMKVNEDLCVEIAGHVDAASRPPAEKNSFKFELSAARALSVYNSLVAADISQERMVAKGYANWKPKYLNLRDAEKNRRVEIIVSDCNKIKEMENDSITSGRNYLLDRLSVNFRKTWFPEMRKLFTDKEQKAIIKSLVYLKSKNLDSSQYTYGDLLLGDEFPSSPKLIQHNH